MSEWARLKGYEPVYGLNPGCWYEIADEVGEMLVVKAPELRDRGSSVHHLLVERSASVEGCLGRGAPAAREGRARKGTAIGREVPRMVPGAARPWNLGAVVSTVFCVTCGQNFDVEFF